MTHRPRADRILVRWRVAAAATTCLAAVGAALMASPAPAATRHLTLKAEHVSSLSATVLAAPNGRTLYRLKPETTHHLLCTSSTCLSFWHPLTVSSKSTKLRLPSGLSGHAHLFKRGHRFQVTLGSDPLYTFGGDSSAGDANGKGIKSFGGTWLTFTVTKDSTNPAPAPMPGPYPTY
jgi:predicted lipoprotein with Yx(FWY)xxD motif